VKVRLASDSRRTLPFRGGLRKLWDGRRTAWIQRPSGCKQGSGNRLGPPTECKESLLSTLPGSRWASSHCSHQRPGAGKNGSSLNQVGKAKSSRPAMR